jgi:FlaA1/EpsC-like NDP-sugar epimerase
MGMAIVEDREVRGGVAPELLIDWDDLLDRPRVPVERQVLGATFVGRRVAITGAAGSLGRDLAACIADYRPASLTLIDSSEAGLFALRERLLAAGHDEGSLGFRLADVRSRRRVHALFAQARPEIVFHLAAYKHVPWAEVEPSEYLDANLGGGRVVIEEAAQVGAARIVYPSTDKAVNPPSLYGATKRIIEAQLREVAAHSATRAVAARFVNVLGSQGSVGVTFARMIAAGRPLPLTDPGMTRYWIAPHHGTLLLAYAAASAFDDPFTILLPDALPAVPVVEIARRIWQQLGHEGEPPLVVTGLRPGERLHEELTGAGESYEQAPYRGILHVRGMAEAPPGRPIAAGIDQVLAAIEAGETEADLKTRALTWAHAIR